MLTGRAASATKGKASSITWVAQPSPTSPSCPRSRLRKSEKTRRSRPAAMSVAVSPLASAQSRSEEHTSELQSLMRISYAVFCLKKKKNQQHTSTTKPSIRKNNTSYHITLNHKPHTTKCEIRTTNSQIQ